jgi:hypothetical protein
MFDDDIIFGFRTPSRMVHCSSFAGKGQSRLTLVMTSQESFYKMAMKLQCQGLHKGTAIRLASANALLKSNPLLLFKKATTNKVV